MKFAFIDLETTGTNPEQHAVTQIAGRLFDGDEELAEFNYNVRPFPGQLVSPEALRVTGKSIDELRTFQEAKDVHYDLTSLLAQFVNKFDKRDKFVFVAYNAKFDFDFLWQWFNNCGDKYFGSFFWTPPICVMMQAMQTFLNQRPELPNFKLGTVCRFAGIDFSEDDAHDAMYDIDKTIELYRDLPNFE